MQAQGRSWPRRRCWCLCGTMTWAQLTTSLVRMQGSGVRGPMGSHVAPDPCPPNPGGVQLSSQAGGERQWHWCECLGRSDHRLELWHPLDGVSLQLSD